MKIIILLFLIISNASAKWGDDAMIIIKKNEGFRATPYKCSAGRWTIGYGFTASKYTKLKSITKKKATVILKGYMIKIYKKIKKYNLILKNNQKIVLLDFIYHYGYRAFSKSTLKRKLDAGLLRAAGLELLRWKYAKVNGRKVVVKGLWLRCQRNYKLWNKAS